jgi:N-acetylglucosamine-6-phosphate deacetylase
LAPEHPNSLDVVKGLRERGIRVAIGHTKANIKVSLPAWRVPVLFAAAYTWY